MVSLQSPLSSKEEKPCLNLSNLLCKKRRWEDVEESNCKNLSKDEEPNADIEIHLDNPLPSEWQQCLDLQSGRIHYYNTRTYKTTCKEPMKSSEAPICHQGLDLDLNLACQPQGGSVGGAGGPPPPPPRKSVMKNYLYTSTDTEMVVAVCLRCHMLVIMSKATLSCPNCKFVQPPTPCKLGVKLLYRED
ncbi:uncharacterized protein [Typha latifolia]|uniref:uncharacterized protein n=1 Tax=Typha latifolia TaxID=4733 RepID=UPI003C2DD44A